MEPGAPRKMFVKGGTASLEIGDILVGEVWVASGQSNMDWPLTQARDGQEAIAAADLPEIRLFNLNRGGANPRSSAARQNA
jgi:sialate O-acetylesterase